MKKAHLHEGRQAPYIDVCIKVVFLAYNIFVSKLVNIMVDDFADKCYNDDEERS